MLTSQTARNSLSQTAALNQHSFELGNKFRECEPESGRLSPIYRLGERIFKFITPRLYTNALASCTLIYPVLVQT